MREGGAKEDDKERIEERKREALPAQTLVAKKKSRFHVIDVICKQEPRASFFFLRANRLANSRANSDNIWYKTVSKTDKNSVIVSSTKCQKVSGKNAAPARVSGLYFRMW